jgi:D-aspartate ligase
MLHSRLWKRRMLAKPQRTSDSLAPVVVLSVFQTGLNLMRDLCRHGVRVAGVDCVPDHPGFRSRYGKSYLCPNPDLEPAEWVAFMKSLSTKLGSRPVIIPAADIFVDALGRHGGELEQYYNFSLESAALQAKLVTKEQQYALAASVGLPSPRFAYIESAKALDNFCNEARFPCVLKPLAHREWEALPKENFLYGKKAAMAETAGQLWDLYRHAEPFQPRAVAQEFIVGSDDAKFCYLSIYGRGGQRLGYCVVRELRCHPIQVGSASIVEPVVDEEIAEVCDRFLRQIQYTGLCEIEVKRDVRDGRVLLIEVNPRFSVTGDCSIYAGVDAGWLHYLDRIGKLPEPMKATRLDFRHIYLTKDAAAFRQYLKAGLTTWGQWWSAYWPPIRFYDVDFRDWRVTSKTLYQALRQFGGTLLEHWHLRF